MIATWQQIAFCVSLALYAWMRPRIIRALEDLLFPESTHDRMRREL